MGRAKATFRMQTGQPTISIGLLGVLKSLLAQVGIEQEAEIYEKARMFCQIVSQPQGCCAVEGHKLVLLTEALPAAVVQA